MIQSKGGAASRFGRNSAATGTILGYPGAPPSPAPELSEPPAQTGNLLRGGNTSDPLSLTQTLLAPREGSQAPALEPGGANRFALVERLGEGAMGEVALVQDRDIDRPVAVKLLREGLEHPTIVARFVDEIRTIGRLEHPNIAPIHDVGVNESGRPYFVMKYVEGEDLSTIIDKLHAGDPEYHKRFTVEVRMQIFMGLLRALEFAHSRGIIHRDVKPENIMVGHHGEVTLMDWGIAKPIGAEESLARVSASVGEEGAGATQVGEVIGTPLYMSPEQARGENDVLDARTDLYSASVVLHELLTLDHYMKHVQDLEELLEEKRTVGWRNGLMAWHRSTQRPMPPMELFHYVRKGLQIDRDKRFQSAAEMIERLQGLIEGRVPVQCHITLVKSSVRGLGRIVDRHPWLSFGASLALVSAAGAGLLNLIF